MLSSILFSTLLAFVSSSCSPCISICFINAGSTQCPLKCDEKANLQQKLVGNNTLKVELNQRNASCPVSYRLIASGSANQLLFEPNIDIKEKTAQSIDRDFSIRCLSYEPSLDFQLSFFFNTSTENTSYMWTVSTDCSNPTTTTPSSPPSTSSSDRNKIIIVASSIGGAVMIIIIVLLTAIYLRKQPVNPENLGRRATVQFVNTPREQDKVNDAVQSYRTLKKLDPLIPHELEFSRQNLEITGEIGYSTFGKVYEGTAEQLLEGEEKTPVIIEVLEDIKENDDEMTRSFSRRLEKMASIDHPHVSQLLGVISSLKEPSLIFELPVDGENFKEFLLAEKDNLTNLNRISYAKQIADAMAYFEAKRHVHRDLATRNCHVINRERIQVFPFGIVTPKHEGEYHKVGHKTMLPIRWLPHDVIAHGKFTAQTDVHAFGVVLWEIFSRGALPYDDYANEEVLYMLKKRDLLPKPDPMPDDVYDLMTQCWKEKGKPTFSILHQSLKVMLF